MGDGRRRISGGQGSPTPPQAGRRQRDKVAEKDGPGESTHRRGPRPRSRDVDRRGNIGSYTEWVREERRGEVIEAEPPDGNPKWRGFVMGRATFLQRAHLVVSLYKWPRTGSRCDGRGSPRSLAQRRSGPVAISLGGHGVWHDVHLRGSSLDICYAMNRGLLKRKAERRG